jgi:transcriptional regulator with XRE-family HTH domain
MRWKLLDQLLKARTDQDISTREMGIRMDVCKTTIRRWENAINDPPLMQVLRMAAILNLRLELVPAWKTDEE